MIISIASANSWTAICIDDEARAGFVNGGLLTSLSNQLAYARDKAGRILAINSEGSSGGDESFTFAYNDADWLLASTSEARRRSGRGRPRAWADATTTEQELIPPWASAYEAAAFWPPP